ncbi:MAG: hypothetical protein HS124_08600 [Anaerolineales bacterium]|nr:hypothetical protein [Anaerolineales bacterium]MCL4259936.1 hypothetical protein [Anaerolineales bacterium]
MSDSFFPPRPAIRRAEALPQYVEALRAGGESAKRSLERQADFHELREGFIPYRHGERKQPQ